MMLMMSRRRRRRRQSLKMEEGAAAGAAFPNARQWNSCEEQQPSLSPHTQPETTQSPSPHSSIAAIESCLQNTEQDLSLHSPHASSICEKRV